jgi:hypothetical protein
MYRIMHIGLGPLGQKIIGDLYRRKLGVVVAAVDRDPQFIGRRISDILPGIPCDAKVMGSLDDYGSWDRTDATLVTTSSDLRACADTFRQLLPHGETIVSTCEELTWPWLRHPELSRELNDQAISGRSRLLGTGVNPGCLMDMMPTLASCVCHHVDRVEIHRIQDATTRRIPFQKKIGATLDADAFNKGIADGWLRHVGLGESLHFVAHYLGFKIDSWSETIEPVKAEADMSCGLGPIKKGNARGVRQVATGLQGGKEVIRLVFQAAIGQTDPQDRVIITGEPNVDLVLRGGVHGDIATSAMTLNSIKSLLAAKPGLHTMASVPLVHCTPSSLSGSKA